MLNDYQDTVSFAELIAKLKQKEFELQGLRTSDGRQRSKGRHDLFALTMLLAGQSRRTLQPGLCRKCMMTVAESSGLQEAVRAAEPSPILMSDYISAISAALMTPFDGRIRLILNVEPALALDEDRAQWIGLIFAEAATNALKHAFPGLAAGVVAVDMRCDQQRLRLAVSDNGAGFGDKAESQPNNGLAFMKSLAQRLGGDVTVASSRSGTTVSLNCPMLPGSHYG